MAGDPIGKPHHHSYSCVLPVRPVKGGDTGPFSMVMPSSFATPSVTWWVPALMIKTYWVSKPDGWSRCSLQYLTCLKTSRSLTDKLSFDVGLQAHSTGGLWTRVHVGSLTLHKQWVLIKTTSRLCLCRRGLLVDDPPSIQAEVRRREGAHRRWPDSRQRVHRTIPGRLEAAASLVTDALRVFNDLAHKKAPFKVWYQTLEIQWRGDSRIFFFLHFEIYLKWRSYCL